MATKGVEMQTMECPVCFENYNEPKILPCAHLLCRRCLVSLMTKKRDALCPLCSSAIVDPQDFTSKSCEDLIDSLPTDHAMSAMVESVKVLSEKHMCHAHRSVATSLCLQCSVKLCQSCVEGHKILPVTSSHKLEDLSTLTLEVLTASRQEPCSEHPDKISELFCTFHNVLICHLCAASQHRACPEVTGLNEMYDKNKQSLSDLKAKLNITMSSLEQAITRTEEHLVQTEKNMKVTFAEIDKTCDSLLNSVETCRKRLKKLVQDADDKIKVTALDQKSSLGERRGRLTSHINLINRVQQMAHGSSLVAMVPKLESLIAKLHLDTTLPEEAGQGLKMVTLTIDPNASVRVKSELDKIGNLIVSSATIQDERVTRTQVQDSPNSNLTSPCRVSIPNELLQGSDPEACLKNILLKTPDLRISKTEHNIIFLVSYDCLVKLATTIQEQITNHTVVRQEDNSQNQITHMTSTTEINSLEFEAMQHLLSHDFFQHFSKVKEDGEKVIITSDTHETMEKFKEMYNLIRQEKVKLAQDEVSCLEKSADFLSEDVEAFIKLLPLESKVVIICFDYNAMTKAKHLLNVKVGKVKITQRNKRKFEVGGKESDEMIDHQTSLTAVSYIDSNSGHSHVKHKVFTTKSGIQLSVYKDDITQLTVDVIVNAANRDLKHDGGVAYAIARAAGPSLELEGDDYVKVNGQLKVTDVVPTTAGNLPCRKVLHAVGPLWDDYQNKEQCQHDLEQTVFSCLEKAHNLRFSSIALSSISSVISVAPKEVCARMYLAAVKKFEEEYGGRTSVQYIHFVDIDDVMVGTIQETFQRYWNTSVTQDDSHQTANDMKQTYVDQRSPLATQLSFTDTKLTTERYPLFWDWSKNHTEKQELCYMVEFPKLKLFIKKADVTDVYSDAVVFWQTSMKMLLEEPVKNYVKKRGEKYPIDAIQSLKRKYSTVDTVKLGSDLTLIFSVNPSDMTSARVEERIRSILNTVSNSDFRLSIPFPLCIKAAGAKRKSLEQFAVGVYLAVEIYAKNMDKSLIEVNVMDKDEKSINILGEIISNKIAHDKSLIDAQNRKASSHAASAGKVLEAGVQKCAVCNYKTHDLIHFPCGHGFCSLCTGNNFQQNPVCFICSNKLHLKGSMSMIYSGIPLEGFEDVGSFVITYYVSQVFFMDKQKLCKIDSSLLKMAYLPDTENGRKVLMLLKLAWDRGLTFTLSQSGNTPTVIWNGIEHKTQRKGGHSDGYPDLGYLNRVQQILAARGVTEKELSDKQKDFISHPVNFLKSANAPTDFSYLFHKNPGK